MSAVVSQEKIADALKLLEEAAKDNVQHVRQVASGKFDLLKDALLDEHGLREKISQAGMRASELAKHMKEVSEEKAKEIAGTIDHNVKKNPWPYIGGVAVGALLLGFILGRKTS